ncbi:MAG: macrocin-O-methyltransferase [Verrucomicrobia bacterium]|nr:MAG: macrocin-O-methyltransferase [Verrucomicrobiota bacterium]
MKPFDGYHKQGIDSEIEDRLAAHCAKFGIDPLNALKLFPVLVRRQWLKRFLAHHELFKLTLEVPGDIAELGVFRGAGLMTWANFLESYCIGDRTKVVFGFDNWKGFTDFAPEDGREDMTVQKTAGGFSPSAYFEELKNALGIFDSDRFVGWKERVKLVEGHIEETVPAFVNDNPGVRFSLIHFDCDLYEPTKAALTALWPVLSRGGLMLFDEYAIHNWPGETRAVDEFFKDKPEVRVRTLPWNNVPAGYVIKD